VKRNGGLALSLFGLLLLGSGCGSIPSCVESMDIFRAETFYAERAEPEVTRTGRLSKNCPPPSPNGRDHCYFVDGLPVYSGNRSEVLDRYVGAQVTLRGKRVTIMDAAEFWPATICRQSIAP
jgi:hypothetical protein